MAINIIRKMNFKLTKSDIYVMLLYFAVVIPINCMDYADYEDKTQLIYEALMLVSVDLLSIYFIIFLIFPTFFPQKKYLSLILWSILVFFIIGFIFVNIACFIENCKANVNTMSGLYFGVSTVAESFAIPGIFLISKKLYDAQLNFAKMEKEKKESELLRLNAQIDPHFLFNNLNTIDSLIDTDPSAAKTYLHKLSQLYRYLIATKDQEVVELSEEINFAQNYIYLIQSRFGNAFQFEIIQEINKNDPYFIPPGALQTLLENIVKHNQASSIKPIKCLIKLSQDGIVVSNNLIHKRGKVDSTGTGLQNLKTRYKLLTDKEIQIEKAENFIVSLPLIKQVA